MPTKQPSRRSFLKTSAAAGGAVVASGSLGALRAASPVHQGGGKLKVGIVGVDVQLRPLRQLLGEFLLVLLLGQHQRRGCLDLGVGRIRLRQIDELIFQPGFRRGVALVYVAL